MTFQMLGNDSHNAIECSTDDLLLEYRTGMRHAYDRVFGHVQRRALRIVAEELIRRGVTSLPNIFGDIAITTEWK